MLERLGCGPISDSNLSGLWLKKSQAGAPLEKSVKKNCSFIKIHKIDETATLFSLNEAFKTTINFFILIIPLALSK